MSSTKPLFNCERCPAYCCSYPVIEVTKKDLRRLAKHFGLSLEQAVKKFTKRNPEGKKRVLRHRSDEHFGSVCRFLDRETRACTVYHARPQICRDFPGTRRCGYYEFLKFERDLLKDPDHVATTYNT
ncbi:MAG: YkgJ family cysteine cluster protein [Kiloniellales bacterium]|jgi:Fe-S-cluster containining protein|nr:YkgJ family cysteine cluster protein [Kiloniellales bacterium]